MAEELFEQIRPKPVRQFDPINGLVFIASVITFIVWAMIVASDRDPFRLHDVTLFAAAVGSAAGAIERAFPREHRAARVLRVLSTVALIVAFLAGISAFLPSGNASTVHGSRAEVEKQVWRA